MPKNLGYGVTAWARGLASGGHLDGIGIYTRELYQALKGQAINLQPFAFGDTESITMPCGAPHLLEKRISKHLVQAALFRRKIPCKAQIFHATDHFIPSLDIPVVATVMDLIPFIHPEWVSSRLLGVKNWLFKQSILSANHIITISQHSKLDLMHHFGIAEQNISVTPLGVDPIYFKPIAPAKKEAVLKQYGLPEQFFLFVGTLQPRKNLETLLHAHALLPHAIQRQFPLVIVGRNGWGVESLLPKLKHLENQGCVRWLNYLPRDHVMALLQCAIAMVFVSLYEGFGLPVIEAFAAGCPVIGSDSTSIPEVAGDAALLVNPRHEVQLSDALLRLIDDKNFRDQLLLKGRERAKRFTWDACADATLEAYAKVSL